MSKYLDKFIEYMRRTRKAVADETNPHRKAILNNYYEHAAFEFSNRDQDILTPKRTVKNPLYHVKRHGAEMATYEGLDAVQGYYDAVNREVIMLNDEQLMVNDWGVSSYSTLVRFVSGAKLATEGHTEALEAETIYVQSSPLAMFWPYNADGIMLGEDVYELDRPKIEKPALVDVVTLAMRVEAAREFLPTEARSAQKVAA